LSKLSIKVGGGNIYNLIIFDNKIEKIPSIDILFLLFNTTSAVRCYLSTSKSQSRYRPFRFEIFLMRAQSPSDPLQSFGYGFKLPDTGHWQSGTIALNRPFKCKPMQDISKLHLQKTLWISRLMLNRPIRHFMSHHFGPFCLIFKNTPLHCRGFQSLLVTKY